MKKTAILAAISIMMIYGCGEKAEDTLEGIFRDNAFFKGLSHISVSPPPTDTTGEKGDTTLPIDGWRNIGEPTIDYTINISEGEADIPISAVWPDTIYVVYTDLPDTSIRDTVIKPSPFLRGSLTFYYSNTAGEWEFDGLSLLKIESDSAQGILDIDSIKAYIIRDGTIDTLPTITQQTEMLPADEYPYTFSVGDSVRVDVYETSSVDSRWVFLCAPHPDVVHWFGYSEGRWTGTWILNSSGNKWALVDICDIDIIFDKSLLATRERMWGIPYIVEE